MMTPKNPIIKGADISNVSPSSLTLKLAPHEEPSLTCFELYPENWTTFKGKSQKLE